MTKYVSTTKSKHLTREEREVLEDMLNFNCTFKHIGSELGKDPTTISKEVKRNSITVAARGELACASVKTCALRATAPKKQCPRNCAAYSIPTCSKLKKAPFVCNGCKQKPQCRLQKSYYRAKEAQCTYKEKLSVSRQGINLDSETFNELDKLITKGVSKGQSPANIIETQAGNIPISSRSIYRYFEQNLFSVRNIDLPRKVRYKLRKKKKPEQTAKKVISGRDYRAFEKFVQEKPEIHIVEADTVYGSTLTTLLTFQFCKTGLMIARLIPDRKAKTVVEELNLMQKLLNSTAGATSFERLFPVILLDNGVEFSDTLNMETDENECTRTCVFYCDPYSSYQKPHVEKNHEHIRQILPKGTDFSVYTQDDIDLMMSHIILNPD
jgi:IS30 family transposase